MLNATEDGLFFLRIFSVPDMLVSISEKAKNEGAYAY
jgi:hypothetical protein